MVFGSLNSSETLQRKLPNQCLSPSICSSCLAENESSQHLFFDCPYSSSCWYSLFAEVKISWAFGSSFKENGLQLLMGPSLKSASNFIWINVIKAIPLELGLERNQRIFQSKAFQWRNPCESAKNSASTWCSFSKKFMRY